LEEEAFVGEAERRKGFMQIVCRRKKGFTQIVADKGADLRRFWFGEYLEG
jgi:hypothetical protein